MPVRVKVDIIITKGKEICLCKFHDSQDHSRTWYGFPGGGVDGDDTLEETARKECLEEVGILVRDIRKLNSTMLLPFVTNKPERKGKYSYVIKHMFTAKFDRLDKSLYGKDGDAVEYEWVSLEEANNQMVVNGPWGEQGISALKVLFDDTRYLGW